MYPHVQESRTPHITICNTRPFLFFCNTEDVWSFRITESENRKQSTDSCQDLFSVKSGSLEVCKILDPDLNVQILTAFCTLFCVLVFCNRMKPPLDGRARDRAYACRIAAWREISLGWRDCERLATSNGPTTRCTVLPAWHKRTIADCALASTLDPSTDE